jgi:hypothetical protein
VKLPYSEYIACWDPYVAISVGALRDMRLSPFFHRQLLELGGQPKQGRLRLFRGRGFGHFAILNRALR